MPGAQSVFVGALSALLHKEVDRTAASGTTVNPLANIQHLLGCALIAKRRFLKSGFANTDSGVPFLFERTTNGSTHRGMPKVVYSEGIFSHLEATSPQDASSDRHNLRYCLERSAETLWNEYVTSSQAPPTS
jgi:hypothetical protein